jgi:hypothetical protein
MTLMKEWCSMYGYLLVMGLLWIGTQSVALGASSTRTVVINEVLASNGNSGKDPQGRYVHVYINGLHCLHERPDHAWAAQTFGGGSPGYDDSDLVQEQHGDED